MGRHILIGAAGGIVFSAVLTLPAMAPWFGAPPWRRTPARSSGLRGARFNLAGALEIVQQSFSIPFVVLLLLLLLRVVLRRPWLVYAAWFALLIVPNLTRPMLELAVVIAWRRCSSES